MWTCCGHQRRLFRARNQLETYTGYIGHTYRIESALLPTDFTERIFHTAPQEIFKEIEYALRMFMREKGAIFQHTVVIIVDNRWVGSFIVEDNLYPSTLVLELK